LRVANPQHIYQGKSPNQTPKWRINATNVQHGDIWVMVAAPADHFKREQPGAHGKLRHPHIYLHFAEATDPAFAADPSKPNKEEGTLVLTGHVQHKKLAFVFLKNRLRGQVEVPNDPAEDDANRRLVDRFQDDDQLTRWQRLAFRAGSPTGAGRGQDGHLRDGEPVFFIAEPADPSKVVFFGRAQMFRIPYEQRPRNLVPQALRRPLDLDYADALFGFIRDPKTDFPPGTTPPEQGSPERAYAGRVSVTDAQLEATPAQGLWLDGVITPKILASPKPTCFQHYLIQGQANKKSLNHYDSPTTDESGAALGDQESYIRGHKRYWPRGNVSVNTIQEQGHVGQNDTQHTRIKPLRAGVTFRFRVHFENLSDRELGALCWALQPLGAEGRSYCHQLGMGKALGLGAAKLEATLHRTVRSTRYSALFKGCDWETGAEGGIDLSDRNRLADLVKPFEEHLLTVLNPKPSREHLFGLRRIAVLLRMMEWNNNGPVVPENWIKDMGSPPNGDPGEFKSRKILPDPGHLNGPALTGAAVPNVPAGSNPGATGLLPPSPHELRLTISSETSEPFGERARLTSSRISWRVSSP
jgi:CRISPR-associated protein (TIGR03986 family)